MTDATTLGGYDRATQLTNYDRALRLEPALRAIELVVDALCELGRKRPEAMCNGCAWGLLIKPLVTPLLGWSRGYPTKQAKAPGAPPWTILTGAELLAVSDSERSERSEPENENETWLRCATAYDAVNDVWLERLHDADPGVGCGLGLGQGRRARETGRLRRRVRK
jgi:hypothetical protein